MTSERTTIEPFLTEFVRKHGAGKRGAARVRIQYIDKLLRRYLERISGDIDCPHCRMLLAAERVLDPVDAFARVMDLDDLVFVLIGFVHHPWLQTDPEMRLTQWTFVEALLLAAQGRRTCHCSDCEARIADLRRHIDMALHPERR